MRCRRLLVALTGALVAIVAAVALLGSGLASAKNGSGLASAKNGQVRDPRDPRTPLDIRSLSYRLSGKNIVWTLRTDKPFSSKIFKSGSIPYWIPSPHDLHQFIHYRFYRGVNQVGGDDVGDVYVYRSHGKLVGQWYYLDPYCDKSACLGDKAFVPVARPNSRSVKVTVPLGYITDRPSYGLAAETFFQGKQKCRKGCVDAAPNRGFLKHRLYPAQTLDVSVVGDGWVDSSPKGIACSSRGSGPCSADFKRGTTVTLTARGLSQSFTGWSGACTGINPVCSLTMDGYKSVSAAFSPISP